VVEQVYRFAGLPILDGLQEGVLRSSGKHNAGSLWGGSSYTGKLQAHATTATLPLTLTCGTAAATRASCRPSIDG
jgi:hypothetical protein